MGWARLSEDKPNSLPSHDLSILRGRGDYLCMHLLKKSEESEKLFGVIARPDKVHRYAKIYGVPCNQSSSIAFDETSSYWSAPKSS